METHPWPEARDALCRLLNDDRDYSLFLDMLPGRRRYDVARAAAQALASYPVLDERHLAALHARVKAGGDDPDLVVGLVACLQGRTAA